MMYVNLIWAWGHPEVYILILPVFGVFSEVIATFSGKALFGYRSMVLATLAICVLSFMVWLHHFFTMGASADVNAFFGIMSMIIAVPTGVKVFNWLFTLFHGRVRFTPPVLWSIGFMVTFVVGGMTGVLLAVPPVDFILHNSVFLIAHFHNVIIGGVVFGVMAGYNYWFPKAFGFTLHEGWGKASFWCWFVGFYLAFMPLYMLGLMGMTRRLQHIADPDMAAAAAGCRTRRCRHRRRHPVPDRAALCQHPHAGKPARSRPATRGTGGPWSGRPRRRRRPIISRSCPKSRTIDAFWDMKQRGVVPGAPTYLAETSVVVVEPAHVAIAQTDIVAVGPAYEPIEMPRNTPDRDRHRASLR